MRLGDALDDCQAKADSCVIGTGAPAPALERLDERRGQTGSHRVAGVLYRERDVAAGLDAGRDPHHAVARQIVNDRVVDEVRRQLEKERRRTER